MSHTSSISVITVLALLVVDIHSGWLPYSRVLASGVYRLPTLLLCVDEHIWFIPYPTIQQTPGLG